MQYYKVARVASLAAAAWILMFVNTASAQSLCDRACLKMLMDSYLAALVAHDPSGVQRTQDFKFTENTNRLALGDGLWQTIEALGTFKLVIEDPADGEAAFYGTVKENGVPALLGIRLRAKGRRISEVETLVVRKSSGIHVTFEALNSVDPIWEESVPANERSSREQLINAANQYFEGIVHGDGDIVPFGDDCVRMENGAQTAPNPNAKPGDALSARAQFNTKTFNYIYEITNRRFLVADSERGLVVAFAQFQHPGNIRRPDRSVTGVRAHMDLSSFPNTTQIMEVFQLRGGRIRHIFAYIALVPYRQSPGW